MSSTGEPLVRVCDIISLQIQLFSQFAAFVMQLRPVINNFFSEPGKITEYVKKIVKEMPKLDKLMAAGCGIAELPDVSCLSNLRVKGWWNYGISSLNYV